jgi:type IV secretion system protein VirD4
MQLPAAEELVLVSGCPPIRARKARYYEDRALQARIRPAPTLDGDAPAATDGGGWAGRIIAPAVAAAGAAGGGGDADNAGVRREPELPEHEEVAPPPAPEREFEDFDEGDDLGALVAQSQRFRAVSRQAALDPDDGMDL